MGSAESKTLRADWMEKLPEHLRNYPLYKLAIPGSHESGTYDLSVRKGLAPDFPLGDRSPLLRAILGTFCISHLITKKWSRCQDLSFLEQLNAGVRFFDLRIGKRNIKEKPDSNVRFNSDVISKCECDVKEGCTCDVTEGGNHDVKIDCGCDVGEGCKCDDQTKEDSFHFVHGLYGPTVRDCMNDVKTFLDLHQNEVLLLEFHRFHNFNDEDHALLADMLNSIFGDLLCRYSPAKSCEDLTLKKLCEELGTRVIVFYYDWGRPGRGRPETSEHFWPYSSITSQTSWANTTSVDEWVNTQHSERSYRHGEIPDRPSAFYVCQGVLTPDGGGRLVLKNLCCTLFCCGKKGTLKTECGDLINPVLVDWVREDAELEPPSRRRCVIYTADFVGGNYRSKKDRVVRSFVQSVIDLNLLLDEESG